MMRVLVQRGNLDTDTQEGRHVKRPREVEGEDWREAL